MNIEIHLKEKSSVGKYLNNYINYTDTTSSQYTEDWMIAGRFVIRIKDKMFIMEERTIVFFVVTLSNAIQETFKEKQESYIALSSDDGNYLEMILQEEHILIRNASDQIVVSKEEFYMKTICLFESFMEWLLTAKPDESYLEILSDLIRPLKKQIQLP